MIQKIFAEKVKAIVKQDDTVTGLAAGGSYITNEMDEFSDLDLIIVSKEKVGGNKELMLQFATKLGILLSAFTGEHVGEPRLLICLYDDPLLHVDLKFVTIDEFQCRVENPIILIDKEGLLQKTINETQAVYPYPDYQWIEDRFWIWVHYGLLKIGRGEYMEANDFLTYLRMMVLGPLLHIKNGNLPRGVRKVELLPEQDHKQLQNTIGSNNKIALIIALENVVALYRELREELFTNEVLLQDKAEEKVLEYLAKINNSRSNSNLT